VDGYLGAIRSFAQRLSLEQNRLPISGIITNLLDLLGWLSEKKVAMRDLKPDNILVAGDTQNYPGFLRSAADYSLGFIDVETAVYFGKTEEGSIRQPLLGGTHATPSHLFPNSTLADVLATAASAFPDCMPFSMIFGAPVSCSDRTALRLPIPNAGGRRHAAKEPLGLCRRVMHVLAQRGDRFRTVGSISALQAWMPKSRTGPNPCSFGF
jgi:serine/threonine protein kinase